MKMNSATCPLLLTAFFLTGNPISPLRADDNLPTTATEQADMTPGDVLNDLLEGNRRYMEGSLTAPNIKNRIVASGKGQHPKAVILSCLDSRVPVEMVFDQGIGDIFVGRVAGNVENEDQLGSMEFGTKVAGAKLIMVLGHEACGAVKGACDHVKLGNLSLLLEKIAPAVDAVPGHLEKGRNSKNPEFVEAVVKENVIRTVNDIRERSPILAAMEREGKIKIVGAVYSLKTGEVSLVDTPVFTEKIAAEE